jgi:hypothetical protein
MLAVKQNAKGGLVIKYEGKETAKMIFALLTQF